jgi:hypothetical protein
MRKKVTKQIVSLLAALVLFGIPLGAQEEAADSVEVDGGGQASAPQGGGQPQMPPPAYAKLWMGDLTIHGRLMTGFKSAMTDQEGLEESGNWSWQAINPGWQENRAELTFDYALGSNIGAFLMLQARAWSPNTFGDAVRPRYAFVWTSLLNDKIKFSFGKLYDEVLILQNKVWKTEGPGERIRFTDEDKFSARVEVKPIPGLNVGAQFFFVDTAVNAVSGLAKRNLADTGAWKEIGLGAMYTHDLFNAQLGIRFDSDVDIMGRDDGKTYLPAYYGDANMLGTEGAYFLGPKYKYKDEVIGKAKFDSSFNVTGYEETPFYSGGHYAFFGFKLKAVKNLDLDAHGGLYNLGAFDKFGYGRFAERFMYKNLVPKLGLGVTMSQEFYGGDVFDDTITNSPFLQFGPEITYDFAYLPGTSVPMLQVALLGQYGISPDVLDAYVYARVIISGRVGIMSVEFFYDIFYTNFVDKIENVPATQYTAAGGIKPETKHVIGLTLDFMF